MQLLDCSYAKLNSIDFSNLTLLTALYCNNNLITAFTNFQEIKSLFALDCADNQLTSLDLSQASVNNAPDQNEVLFKFNNNNLQYLNLQNNKTTIWYCLCSPADTTCAFVGYPGYSVVNTCTYIPSLTENSNLMEVKVNCDEKLKYEQFSSNSITFTENCAVAATQESDFAKKFKIYPNPAKDFIAIETKEKIIEVSVFDYSGKLVSKYQDNFNTISVNHLAKGNYVMKIKTAENIFNYKLIKK